MAIRPDTDSKSPTPRSGALKGELEQYGVWVKAEPHDILDEGEPSASDLDFELPGESASVPEEAFLSEDEEKLLGSFDADFEAKSSAAGQGPLPDIEDLPPMEESILESETGPSEKVEDVEDLDAGTVDISLEELESSREPSPISPYAELDVTSIESLESRRKPAHAPQTMEDVSAEFLDSVEEASPAEPGDSGVAADDVTAEFLDLGENTAPERPEQPTADFEPIDIDLTFDDTLPGEQGSGGIGGETAGFEEVTEFDDFLEEPEAAVPAPRAGKAPAADFDDLAALERELSNNAPQAPVGRSSTSDGSPAPDILQKIAQELSSIRGELVSLKAQLTELRPEAGAAPGKTAEEDQKPAGGFFDEEEDETIALTGDELDNILNTADFTEEAAEASSPVDDEGAQTLDDLLEHAEPQDIAILDEAILPESGEYSLASEKEPAIEEMRLGESTRVERPQAMADEQATDFEEISLMAEEGVQPMTPAPEDTSYLETPLSAESDIFGEAPPAEAPLVEPDLSDFDLEAEELGTNPTMEIDEELPVVESAEASTDEITLGMRARPDYAEAPPEDMEALEPLAEIEEGTLEEIDLHHEGHASEAGDLEDFQDIEELTSSEEAELLSTEIESRTIRPAEPIGLHPDEIPTSLDDSFFVGGKHEPESPAESEEELVLDLGDEQTEAGAPIPVDLPVAEEVVEERQSPTPARGDEHLKSEIRSVLAYLDKLLDSLPEDKIEEFARSEHFDTYKRLFEELGLV